MYIGHLAVALCGSVILAAQNPVSLRDPGVSSPILVHKIEPEYSEAARAAGIEGTVMLYVVIDESGVPRDLKVIRSFERSLDAKAIEAVREWRFQPGTKDGKPVAVGATIEVNFRLLKMPPSSDDPDLRPSDASSSASHDLRSVTVDRANTKQTHSVSENSPLRWEPGCPNCARFIQKGVVLKAIQSANLRVYASLTDTGKNIYAYIIARNQTSTMTFDVFPDEVRLEVLKPKRRFLPAIPPREVIAKARRSANRRGVIASLEGFQAFVPKPTYEIRGAYGAAWIYTYDTGAIERANRHVAEIMQQHRSYEERLKAFLLYGESILPEKEVSGAIYFEREKNIALSVLSLQFRLANVPASATVSPVFVEIPFNRDEINRQ